MDLRYFEFSYLPFKDEVSGRAVSSLVAAPFPSELGTWKPCHAGVAMVGMKNLWKNVRSKMIETLSIHILPYSILNIVPWFEYVVNLF